MRILEVKDKFGRGVYLTNERWNHILKHPEMHDKLALEWIKETLQVPFKIVDIDENVKYNYGYYKNRKSEAKYLRVIVKYLNGEGFIITAYFVERIT